MSDFERLLDENDTVGLASLVAAGEVSSVELVEASISRIETRNPTLNAVVAKRYDEARVAVRASGTVGRRCKDGAQYP